MMRLLWVSFSTRKKTDKSSCSEYAHRSPYLSLHQSAAFVILNRAEGVFMKGHGSLLEFMVDKLIKDRERKVTNERHKYEDTSTHTLHTHQGLGFLLRSMSRS